MSTIAPNKYTVVHFRECPTFKELADMSKEWFIIKTHLPGCYGIVLEKKANGEINYAIN